MEDFEIEKNNGSNMIRVRDSGRFVLAVVVNGFGSGSMKLTKKQVKLLHEWLGRYLEKCDE